MSVNASNDNLGWIAPNFKLPDISGKTLSFENIKGENGTVIVFICNHCPYVIKIAERLKNESMELKKNLINTIAIMSNDVDQYPEDSFDNKKLFSKKYNFDFPYLFDETQEVAKNFTAECTPDFFGFNKYNKLLYRGRLDSAVTNSDSQMLERDLYNAMIKIKEEDIGPEEQFNSFGCSIKWKKYE